MAEKGEIEVRYCSTDRILADVLTKPLYAAKFENLLNVIGVLDVATE